MLTLTIIVAVAIVAAMAVALTRRRPTVAGTLPGDVVDDEELMLRLLDEYDFTHLSPEEQLSYNRAVQFAKDHPVDHAKSYGRSISYQDELVIKDRGLDAFEFMADPAGRYLVMDRLEVKFHRNNLPYSTATAPLNYCLPVKNRFHSDCIYFETKVFEFDNVPNGHFSIGLISKPYPHEFRLPGYNFFSVAYESTGNLKISKPLPTPLQQHLGPKSLFNAPVLPPLIRGDVVGIGYHIPTASIFITRNGKKVMDVISGVYLDLYPAIGCFLANGIFQVNIGQLGYVWIEANIKKYGFISTHDFKRLAGDRGLSALPTYGSTDDQVLDRGEALPPHYPEEEIDFFGRPRLAEGSSRQIEEKESSTHVTDEPEEVMDMRERIYEASTVPLTDPTQPLLPKGRRQDYGSGDGM